MARSTIERLASHGYHGRYLTVDVNCGRSVSTELPDTVLRQFLGGSGLGAWLLLTLGNAAGDPLAPEAPLIFSFSPLVGSPLTTSAKFAVVSKSPLTHRINDSLASSGFAISGKRCGCDALVLVGQASQPSILFVDDGEVRLEPAGDLWGMTCRDAQERLKQAYGTDWQIALIGPAGEQQVRFATISHDGRHAGRGGSGAVLGSKRLKAVLVRGTQRCTWADPAGLATLARSLSQRSFGPATAKYRELGTASNLLVFNRLHALPTRNFQQGHFAEAERLAPETLSATRERTRAYCVACTIGCEHIYSLRPVGSESGAAGVRLEYENLFALGPLCGISDPQVVLTASQRCDELGLDTISTGATIAFAMECVDRGLLQEPWLRFGDGGALLDAVELTAQRRGLGARLAEGTRRLAEWIGHGSLDFAPQVKGLELPGYEPRALQTMGLGFAVGARGADHNRSGAYEVDFSSTADRRDVSETAAVQAIATEDRAALWDSLILCKFLRGVFTDFFAEAAEMLQQVTGWDVTSHELRTTARRIVAIRKLFNIRAGWSPAEDTLPARFLESPLPDDPEARLTPERLRHVIAAYNRQREWTSDGWIPTEQLVSLGLDKL